MSLRGKVEFVLFVMLGLLVGLSYVIQRYFVFPTVEMMEDQMVRENLNLGVLGLESRLERLESQCAAWGGDRQRFSQIMGMADGTEAAGHAFLTENGVSYVSVQRSGRAIAELAYDAGTEGPLDRIEVPALPAGAGQWSHHGIAATRSGPMMFAMAPVAGHPEARLVLGRLLNRKLLDEIYFESNIVMHVWSTLDSGLPADASRALARLNGGMRGPFISRNDNLVSAYTVFADFSGQPTVLARADVSRAVVANAYDTMQRGLLVTVAVGMLAFSALVVLFRRSVMNPLSRLTEHATEIDATNDLSRRIGMNRKDEIGMLAREFDAMVGRLDEDIQAREEAEQALRESEERYSLAAEGANDGIWDWHIPDEKMVFSERWKNLLGYEGDEIADRPEEWFSRIHAEDRENVHTVLQAHLSGQSTHFESEHRLTDKDGEVHWMLFRGLALRDADGRAVRMCGSMADVTLRKEYEEQLKHQSLHDSLTELPNRALLIDRLSQSLTRAKRDPKYRFALIFMDLDRFKVVNDGLGHVIGDKLLGEIAVKLSQSIRESDTVTRTGGSTLARFGGDEFVLLLDDLGDYADAVRVAERIQKNIKEPFFIDGNEIYTSASVGIVLSDRGLTSPQEIIRNADTAMYRAKAHGKNRYEIFDPDMHERAIRRLELENDLRKAIDNEELAVYYQPIVCLKTGQIKAFEALVRWTHPERGPISPAEFVPIAEETGLIVPLGQYVMRTACGQVHAWQQQFPHCADLSISVNLSPREFGNAQLVGSIEDTLIRARLNSEFLKVEITESSLMESVDVVAQTLDRIRRIGAQLSIDDFGTGYSSLSHLHRFPMNNLKIDQAFVREMHRSHESMQIIKTIALLAHALGMAIVAEGIEDESHIRVLQEMDCQYGQGFFFSKPVSAERATELLAQQEPEWSAAILRWSKVTDIPAE